MGKIRIFHAVAGGPQVNVQFGRIVVARNLTFSEITQYMDHPPVHHHRLKVTIRSTADDSVLLKTYIQVSKRHQTLIIKLDESSNVSILVKVDKSYDLDYGYYQFNFVNLLNSQKATVNKDGEDIFEQIEPDQKASTVLKLVAAISPVTVTGSTFKIVSNPNFTSRGIMTLFLVDTLKGPAVVISYDNGKDTYTLDRLKSDFDASMYMGKWYQIADIPQFYENNCPRAVAEYTLLQNNVKVVNTCYSNDWNVTQVAYGDAVDSNSAYPAVLTVQIRRLVPPPPPGPIPPIVVATGPNYLVHDTNYFGYSLVGSPNRKSLYILSREPKMSKRVYGKLVRYARRLGYDVNALKLNYDSLE